MFQYIFTGKIQIRRIRNSNVIRNAIKTGGASLALTDKNVSWSNTADISIYFSYCLTLFSGSRNLQVNPRRKRTTGPKKTLLGCCWLPANLAVVKMLLALNLGCTSISYRKCVSLRWRVVLLAVSVINGLQMQRNAFKLFVCFVLFLPSKPWLFYWIQIMLRQKKKPLGDSLTMAGSSSKLFTSYMNTWHRNLSRPPSRSSRRRLG